MSGRSETASRQATLWRTEGHDLHVSINLPPDVCRQIGAGAIIDMIEEAGCDPARIALEMTESDAMVPRPGLKDEMATLAMHGIQLAIDDFGTGHSSLSRLGEFPVRVLKIDRSFVRGLPEGRAACTLVNAIMYLAEGFGADGRGRGRGDRGPARLPARHRLSVRAGLPLLARDTRGGGTAQYASRPNFSRSR